MNQILSEFATALQFDERGDVRAAYERYILCVGLISVQLGRLFAPPSAGQGPIKHTAAEKLFKLSYQCLDRAEHIAFLHFPSIRRQFGHPEVAAAAPAPEQPAPYQPAAHAQHPSPAYAPNVPSVNDAGAPLSSPTIIKSQPAFAATLSTDFSALFPDVPSNTAPGAKQPPTGAPSASASLGRPPVGGQSSTAPTVRKPVLGPRVLPPVQSTLPKLLSGASAATMALKRASVTPDLFAKPQSTLLTFKEDTLERIKVAEDRLKQYDQSAKYAQPPNHLQNVRRLTEDVRILQARRSGIEDDIRRAAGLAFLDLDMRIVAEQLALLSFERFSKVVVEDLEAIVQHKGSADAPSAIAFMVWERHVRRWLMAEVTTPEQPRDRADVITALITVAAHAHEVLNNFEVAATIYSTLMAPGVLRLKKSWSGVPSRTMAQWEALKTLFSEAANFNNLRLTLSRVSPPAQPYLGLFVADIESSSRLYRTSSNGNLSEAGLAQIHSIYDQIRRFQEEPFASLQSNLMVQHYMFTRNTVNETQCLKQSLKLEPLGKKEVLANNSDIYEEYLSYFMENVASESPRDHTPIEDNRIDIGDDEQDDDEEDDGGDDGGDNVVPSLPSLPSPPQLPPISPVFAAQVHHASASPVIAVSQGTTFANPTDSNADFDSAYENSMRTLARPLTVDIGGDHDFDLELTQLGGGAPASSTGTLSRPPAYPAAPESAPESAPSLPGDKTHVINQGDMHVTMSSAAAAAHHVQQAQRQAQMAAAGDAPEDIDDEYDALLVRLEGLRDT